MNPENTDLTKIKCDHCDMRFWVARETDANVCPKCKQPTEPEVRTDAKHPPDDADEAQARAEIEAEGRLDERRERHFDRNGY